MKRYPPSFRVVRSPSSQRGAVLYVAMIMLILLALIGIVGIQVAGLQERMASNYRSENLAFQRAESLARQNECSLEDLVNRTTTAGCGPIVPEEFCDNSFDPGSWADGFTVATGNRVNARLIGPCISGNSALDMGMVRSEDPNPIFQLTVYSTDRDTDPSADAAIDTIFRP